MKKLTLIASVIVSTFTLNAQAVDNNFVVHASETALNGLFSSDGSEAYWPKLAVTILDNSDPNCWIAKATIWRSEIKKEVIPSFKICSDKTIGGAKLAFFAGMFQNQMDVMNNTGMKRTEGPVAPSDAFGTEADSQILYELALITNWGVGEEDTNFWIVN